jgi:glycosyltransferase involved in cell wall biosynthesis
VPVNKQVPLTVVIPIHDARYLPEALRSLTYQHYDNWSVLLVCTNPKEADLVYTTVKEFQSGLPRVDLFTTAKLDWLSAALNAAISNVRTDYWCRLDPDDLLHPMALHVISKAIQDSAADYIYTCRFLVNDKLYAYPAVQNHLIDTPDRVWSGQQFPFSHLITYKNATVAKLGGFKSYDQYPNDAEWIMAYTMLEQGMKFEYVNAAVYYKRLYRDSASQAEEATAASYRKSLILQYWPEQYRDDYGAA